MTARRTNQRATLDPSGAGPSGPGTGPDADEPADPNARVEALAAQQFGVAARRQALDAGLDPTDIRRHLSAGRWRRVAPGVYAFPAHPDIWEQQLWIAHLHAGPNSSAALGSAARWTGLHPIEGEPVELHVPRTATRALPDTVRHRPRDLDASHVEVVRGLPVTIPARTIVDLAGHLSHRRLKEVIQNASIEGQCKVVAVAAMLDSLRRPGKPGVRALGRALDVVGPGGGLPRSELEALLDHVIELSGLPAPVHEQPLPSFGGIVGFVDRTWPDARLIVEADGRRWHTRQKDIARDHDRTLEAARHGYLTLRLIWERLRGDPKDTARALVEIHDGRLRDLAGR